MTSSSDSAQLLASMRSVVAMHRNLGPVVTAGRLAELRAIVERECAWTNDRLEGFANMHPEANSYALMLTRLPSSWNGWASRVPA